MTTAKLPTNPDAALRLIEEGAASIELARLKTLGPHGRYSEPRELRRDRDRWRSGGPLGGLSPGAGGRSLRDPGRQRAHRRFLAKALGLAAPVHAGEVRWPRRACGSPRPATRSLPRTRWRATSRHTRRASSFPSGAASASRGSTSAARATWSRPGLSSSKPSRSWWRWRATSARRCRPLRVRSPPGSFRCTRTTIGTWPSFSREGSSSSAPATREPSSRWRRPEAVTRRGSRAGTPATFPFDRRDSWDATCSRRWCSGSSSTGC